MSAFFIHKSNCNPEARARHWEARMMCASSSSDECVSSEGAVSLGCENDHPSSSRGEGLVWLQPCLMPFAPSA